MLRAEPSQPFRDRTARRWLDYGTTRTNSLSIDKVSRSVFPGLRSVSTTRISISTVTNALLGASLVLVWLAIGPVSLLLAFVPLVPLQQYYRSFAERRTETRVDPTIVRELNALPQDEEETRVRSGSQTNDEVDVGQRPI